VLGAVLGALLEVALIPGLRWGHHAGGAAVPGCFPPPPPALNNYQIFGWTTCAPRHTPPRSKLAFNRGEACRDVSQVRFGLTLCLRARRLATFTLVYVLYAVAVARPGHGSIGPLALGLAVFALISAGAPRASHGGLRGPARLLYAAIVVPQLRRACCWCQMQSGRIHVKLLLAVLCAGRKCMLRLRV